MQAEASAKSGKSTQKAILTRMLTSHAYRERLAAKRFREAVMLAPNSEAKQYVRHVAQEEDSHYARCLEVAKELRIDLMPFINRRMFQRPSGIPRFRTWLDVLLAHALNDKAGYFVLQGIVGSTIVPYAQLAAEIITDEESHGLEGAKMLREYYPVADLKNQEKRRLVTCHLDAAIRCLGRPNSPRDRLAMQMGLKTKTAAETIASFCIYADRLLVDLNCHDLVKRSGS